MKTFQGQHAGKNVCTGNIHLFCSLFPKSTNYNFGSVGKTMIAVENPPTNASNIDRGTCPGLCRGKKKGEKSL
jgi:hypothetical protein